MKKLLLYLLSLSLLSCSQITNKSKEEHFKGDPIAIQKAEAMFTAIGGKEAWAEIRSIYIKARHEEPNLDKPYTSEIWRDLDTFVLRIEQQNEDFHVVGWFTESIGSIYYYHTDSTRTLTDTQLSNAKYDHDHNIYVLWKELAKTPGYEAKWLADRRLEFYDGDVFMAGFELDSLNRPSFFVAPKPGLSEDSQSRFTRWDKTGKLIHPAGGGPVDGNFKFDAEEWKISEKGVLEAFGLKYGE